MRKKHIFARTMAVALSIVMTAGICSTTALAVTGNTTAADGTYSKAAHVSRTAEDDEDENEWNEYDVNVSLTVQEGVFSNITVRTSGGYESANESYLAKAYTKSKGIKSMLEGKPATEATIKGWDTVSGATRTSDAVKAAALAAVQGAPKNNVEADPVTDSSAIKAAIAKAEGLTKGTYTTGSWSAMQTKLTEAKDALAAAKSQASLDEAVIALNAAIKALQSQYVLMNIPYAQFYAADLNNEVAVDAFTSATKNKVKTGTLAGGSYHVDASGDEITGVTFPVKVAEGMDLSGYTRITDESTVDVTVTNRGETTTTTYAGKEALFESATYSYYALAEKPSYYKEVTVKEDGSLSFGATQGTVTTVEGASADLMTETGYGDYQLSLSGLEDKVDPATDQVYGVVISTKEGSDYGLRHLENIWRGTELAWCTGFTDVVHNCPTSSEHYKAMMGQTINKVTYYTSKGIFAIPFEDGIYVPVKFANSVSVENAAVTSGKTTVTVEGIPKDYDPQYRVDGLESATVAGNELSFDAEKAAKGSYTLVISDKSGKYADLSAGFTLYTEEMPVVYNADGDNPALKASEGASEESFKDYIANISSVKVNGTDYPATGRGAVTIINEDGTIKTDAAPFAEGEKFDVVVSATGYQDYTFQYVKGASDPVLTITTTALEKAINDAETLSEADYTAESWSALQSALSVAKTALETKESQEAVDNAATALNAAISGLQKNAGSIQNTSGTTTSTPGNTTSTSGKATVATSSNPQTGDSTNIFGFLVVAILSIGVASLALVSRKKEYERKHVSSKK